VFSIPPELWNETGRGWYGYLRRVDLGRRGLLAYGGERQRGTLHIELNAQGCAEVADWHGVAAWGQQVGAVLTRVDLAHDDFTGETVNMLRALQWHESGGFQGSGRPPQPRYVDDLSSGNGKTLYVGKREHGKMARLYEKGREQGNPDDPWFRVEVEWRRKGRLLPWDMVTRPGHYLAGAYPCLAELSVVQAKIRTVQKTYKLSYEQMVEWLRTAAGRALNVMLDVNHGDAAAVITRLVRPGVPKRLEAFAGKYRALHTEVSDEDPQR